MRWIKENAHVVLQNLTEIFDDLVAFFKQISVLFSARLRAKLLGQRRHDCDERVIRLSEHPLAQLDPSVDAVVRARDLNVKTVK